MNRGRASVFFDRRRREKRGITSGYNDWNGSVEIVIPRKNTVDKSRKERKVRKKKKNMERKFFCELRRYLKHLEMQERSRATIRQYERDIRQMLSFICNDCFSKEDVIFYKKDLQSRYMPSSVNTKLAAVNGFLEYIGLCEWKVRQIKIQKRAYRPENKNLLKTEYIRLIKSAENQGKCKLSMIMQTICSTGIRVSELKFITAESVRAGEAIVQMKGKFRTILIPKKLRERLKAYLRNCNIHTGPIFVTRSGRPLDRSNIWKMMKNLCEQARVVRGKVFPHNLRHLFAKSFYEYNHDITKLADILGHSNVNTTRIYTRSSGKEHRNCMDALGLVIAT